ncbi:MAG: hypothetical protein QXL69_01075 [Candidatus Bathyarchaeia archaeon]|nr:hypothetical protein [Candidatus Bathyarchaeota archaeon]
MLEKGKWKAKWIVWKFKGEAKEENLIEKKEVEGNLLLNEGINAIWTLVAGGTETAYSNSNARIGVGDSNASADPTQTGLLGVNQYYKGMDEGYPTYGSGQKIVFRSTFGTNEANFAWNEVTVDNGAASGKNLNRKVISLGTKTSDQTWIIQLEIMLS